MFAVTYGSESSSSFNVVYGQPGSQQSASEGQKELLDESSRIRQWFLNVPYETCSHKQKLALGRRGVGNDYPAADLARCLSLINAGTAKP